jgi:hypothetical protein
MPEKQTIERARKDLRQGKSASTAAGEFVRQEIHHVREGKHGAKNTKQAIAIGLSEARRAGVPIPDKSLSSKRKRGASSSTRATRSSRSTSRSAARGTRSTTKRARASLKALKRQPHRSASRKALSRFARQAASRRSAASRSATARKAARTRASRAK